MNALIVVKHLDVLKDVVKTNTLNRRKIDAHIQKNKTGNFPVSSMVLMIFSLILLRKISDWIHRYSVFVMNFKMQMYT